MKKIVCKFGGTSTADGGALQRVRNIVESDGARRYIVLSAPGKRFAGDTKITDLLYSAAALAKLRRAKEYKKIYEKVRERFLKIALDTGADERFLSALNSELDGIEESVYSGCDESFAASRGEVLTAKIFACAIGAPYIGAEELIVFSADDKLDETTFDRVQVRLSGVKRAVIPGFYGLGANGKVRTFPRGGGDITGAVIARGVRADVYENWTDVSGVYTQDPKKNARAAALPFLTYAEFAALSGAEESGGAGVLHAEAAAVAKEAGIPIRILNTFRPEEKGTTIALKRNIEKSKLGFVKKDRKERLT